MNNHRPGEAPEQPPLQIHDHRRRSSTCEHLFRAAAASELLRTPPEHQPKRPPQRNHRRRRKHRWTRAAPTRRHRGRRRERGEDANLQKDGGGLPASTSPPEIRPIHTLSTPPGHRSGDSPTSRRRSGRRRGGNPTEAPADAGRAGVALESPLVRKERRGGRFPEICGAGREN